MQKYIWILAIVTLILGGIWFVQERGGAMGSEMKNAEMLAKEGKYAIATSSVNYFENTYGLYAEPAQPGEYPGIVMIHENRGLRPEIRMTAEQLAAEGYRVLAVDLYDGQVAETQEEARAISNIVSQEKRVENMRAAAQYLREQGAAKVASIGWCFGGRQSVELAISGERLDATIVYYGGNMATSTERLAPIQWPVLGIFGDQDQAIPLEMVGHFETSLNTLGIESEIYIYPGVGHAFANPSRESYSPEATMDAWMKTTAFLAKHLR